METNADSDDTVLQAAISGDHDALTQLLEASAADVRNSIHGKIDRRWKSLLSEDDVMQQTYADAFLCVSQFRSTGPGSFSRWLKRMASNNLTDAVRHLSAAKQGGDFRQVFSSAEDSGLQLWDRISESVSTPSLHARRNESSDLLQLALQQLPEAYRQVVVMYDLQGKRAGEVAEACGCSEGAMYMRRSRAHNLLADWLGSYSRLL